MIAEYEIVPVFQDLMKNAEESVSKDHTQPFEKDLCVSKKISNGKAANENDNRMSSSNTTLAGMNRELSFDFVKELYIRRQNNCEKANDFAIKGQKLGPTVPLGPSRPVWSQDASTRLPITTGYGTGYYGYRPVLYRSMTEVKLLGESMHRANNRDVQSAYTAHLNRVTQEELSRQRPSKTIGVHRRAGEFADEGKMAPPPSRAGPMKPSANVAPSQTLQGLADQLPEMRKSNPEDINLNLKKEKSDASHLQKQRRDKLKMVLSRSASSPDGRLLREHVKLISFKTREEATKHYRKLIEHKNLTVKPEVPKVHVVSELEKSYTFVPVVREEVTRPQTDVKIGLAQKGGQYAKSAYGLNMQNAISQKVLNRNVLPVPFRKNHNTFLKHYGTPVVDEKTRHYNSPETASVTVTCTPVSF